MKEYRKRYVMSRTENISKKLNTTNKQPSKVSSEDLDDPNHIVVSKMQWFLAISAVFLAFAVIIAFVITKLPAVLLADTIIGIAVATVYGYFFYKKK